MSGTDGSAWWLFEKEEEHLISLEVVWFDLYVRMYALHMVGVGSRVTSAREQQWSPGVTLQSHPNTVYAAAYWSYHVLVEL